jgi:hypothetical protein
MTSDFDYFKENMISFFKEYGERFIAIKDKTVLGVYDTFDEALTETLKTEELGTFIVQQCTDNDVNFTHVFQSNVYLQ